MGSEQDGAQEQEVTQEQDVQLAMQATARDFTRKWMADLENRHFGSHYLVGVGFTYTMVDAKTMRETGVSVENIFADSVDECSEELRRDLAAQIIEVYSRNVRRALGLEEAP